MNTCETTPSRPGLSRSFHLFLLLCLSTSACARESRVRLSTDEAAKLASLEDRRAPVTVVNARGVRVDATLATVRDHVTGTTTLVLRQEDRSETSRAGLVLFGAGGGLAVFSGIAALFTGIPVIMSPTDVDMSRTWRAEGTFALAGLGSMAAGAILLLVSDAVFHASSGPGEVHVVTDR